jgi:hypothetical protein
MRPFALLAALLVAASAALAAGPTTTNNDDSCDISFTTGNIAVPGGTSHVGGVHPNAIGYATIDVVANCDTVSPIGPGYFGEILFDNVLAGDYQHINPNPVTGNYASGSPLVHIRAVPEGGSAGELIPTSLPFTFYDLYTTSAPSRSQDRRQPLPPAFLPRFIAGGTGAFNTNLQIWREAFAAPAACPTASTSNSNVELAEVVRFDEHENATIISFSCFVLCPPGKPGTPTTLALSAANTTLFPPFSTSGDVGGWLYLNLNNGGSNAYSATRNYRFGTTTRGPRQSQAWVVTSMFAEGRFSVEMDALAVGNGCSLAPDLSTKAPIGPAANVNP